MRIVWIKSLWLWRAIWQPLFESYKKKKSFGKNKKIHEKTCWENLTHKFLFDQEKCNLHPPQKLKILSFLKGYTFYPKHQFPLLSSRIRSTKHGTMDSFEMFHCPTNYTWDNEIFHKRVDNGIHPWWRVLSSKESCQTCKGYAKRTQFGIRLSWPSIGHIKKSFIVEPFFFFRCNLNSEVHKG